MGKRSVPLTAAFVLALFAQVLASDSLKIAVFSVDASPAIGSPLAYDPTKEVTLPLSCRGVVLIGQGQPIVLCSIDWIGVANESHKAFRRILADAVGTTPDRVAVHAIHQHDAPRCDFSVDELLTPYGIAGQFFDSPFARDVMKRAAAAARNSVQSAEPVTHVGLGVAEVKKVASNRRILGPNGKVSQTRYTACKDPKLRAKPVGVIDPNLRMVSFWNDKKPVAVLTYYATHPQSYYRTGGANPDFPGMARNQRQEETGVVHIHFNGAGGNIGAGKWNDGSRANRQILAGRVATAMAKAWKATKKTAITVGDLGWESIPVVLPVSPHLDEAQLLARLQDTSATLRDRGSAADDLVWLRRCKAGDPVEISCLRLGKARVIHMPGELFVEYQLAAQKRRPDLFVAMAAYGDYGSGYIGTEIAYSQGGYETGPRASRVAPQVEQVLMGVMSRLLSDRQTSKQGE